MPFIDTLIENKDEVARLLEELKKDKETEYYYRDGQEQTLKVRILTDLVDVIPYDNFVNTEIPIELTKLVQENFNALTRGVEGDLGDKINNLLDRLMIECYHEVFDQNGNIKSQILDIIDPAHRIYDATNEIDKAQLLSSYFQAFVGVPYAEFVYKNWGDKFIVHPWLQMEDSPLSSYLNAFLTEKSKFIMDTNFAELSKYANEHAGLTVDELLLFKDFNAHLPKEDTFRKAEIDESDLKDIKDFQESKRFKDEAAIARVIEGKSEDKNKVDLEDDFVIIEKLNPFIKTEKYLGIRRLDRDAFEPIENDKNYLNRSTHFKKLIGLVEQIGSIQQLTEGQEKNFKLQCMKNEIIAHLKKGIKDFSSKGFGFFAGSEFYAENLKSFLTIAETSQGIAELHTYLMDYNDFLSKLTAPDVDPEKIKSLLQVSSKQEGLDFIQLSGIYLRQIDEAATTKKTESVHNYTQNLINYENHRKQTSKPVFNESESISPNARAASGAQSTKPVVSSEKSLQKLIDNSLIKTVKDYATRFIRQLSLISGPTHKYNNEGNQSKKRPSSQQR